MQKKKRIDDDRIKLQRLTDIMLEMTRSSKVDSLWSLLEEGALELVNSKHVWIGRLNHHDGFIKTVRTSREIPKLNLHFDSGIIGKALRAEKPILIADVLSNEWQDYLKLWEDTRSELAIPIIIDKVSVRVEDKVQLGSKVIGILNIESPEISAFTEADKDRRLF